MGFDDELIAGNYVYHSKKNEPQENCNRSKIQIIRSNMGGEKRKHSHATEVYLSQSIQFCWKHRKVFAINLINNQMRC